MDSGLLDKEHAVPEPTAKVFLFQGAFEVSAQLCLLLDMCEFVLLSISKDHQMS